MKYTGPKAKRARRQGMNIYGTDKYAKILQKKPNPPGKGPRARIGRPSEYASQLKEKQKARDIYGLSERQFKNIYDEATRVQGRTGDILKKLLELRLDNVLYRAGFAHTRMQARQMAGHGLFMIDGRRVTTPSYRLKEGQVVEVRSRTKDSPLFGPILAAHEKDPPSAWLNVDPGKLRIEISKEPGPDDAEASIDERQVIEFYSRT